MSLESLYKAGAFTIRPLRETMLEEDEENGLRPTTLPGKVLQGGEAVLNVGGNFATRGLYAPLAKALTQSPLSKRRIERLLKSKKTLYPSDVLEATGFLESEEDDSLPMRIAKTATRTAIDIVGDPLTYATFGAKTPLGVMVKAISGAKASKTPIKLGSKVAQQAAKLTGVERASPELLRKFPKSMEGAPLSEQISQGQRSLIGVGLPFTDTNIPIVGGKVGAALAQPLSAVARSAFVTKIGEGFGKLFSTKSGNPEFDKLRSTMQDVAMHRAGIKIEEAKVLNEKINTLTRELGIPRKELNRILTAEVERATAASRRIAEAPKALAPAAQALKQGAKHVPPGFREAYNQGVEESIKQFEAKNYVPKSILAPDQIKGTVDPRIEKMADEIREAGQRQLLDEQTSGIRNIPLLADREYIAHITTPESNELYRELLKTTGGLPRGFTKKDFSTNLVNVIRREFVAIKPEVIDAWTKRKLINPKTARLLKGKHGLEHIDRMLEEGLLTESTYSQALHSLGVDEVNQLGREGKIPFLKGKKVEEFFHTDPVYSTSVRGIRGERARTSAEFFRDMQIRKIAIPAEGAPPGWVTTKIPELEGMVVEPQVGEALGRMHRFQTHPEELQGFLKNFDTIQDSWKAWTLAIFPAYHSRNFVGNLWNNFLAGVNNPKAYIDAGRVQSKQKVSFTDGLGNQWNSEKLRKVGQELGVINRGWYGGDIQRSVAQALEKGTWLKPTPEHHVVKAGFRFGKMIENNGRMAHFIHQLKSGMSAEDASMSVKKFLFDYGDLTDFEKNYMKRLMPFYTWSRFNIPLQLTHLIHQPGKFSVPYKARHEMEQGENPNVQKYLPQWMIENFPARIKYNKQRREYEYFLLNSWLPAVDIAKVFELHDTATNMLTPIPKEVLQQMFNYDTFTKRKIEEIPGQKERFMRMNLPKRITHGAKVIRLLNEVDKLTKEDVELGTKISALATGKTYAVNEDDAYRYNRMRVQEEISELKTGLTREARKPYPSEKEIARIRAMITEKAKEY